ncbi:MAG TPA: hypothetical protein VF717_01850 [Pyrinomonadaceae bacterium]
MKYLVILGVVALIFYLLILWRMRRYFPVVRQIFSITRSLYRMRKGAGGSAPVAAATQSEPDKLVRCASCGTWIPSGRALRLRAKSPVYCSTNCLESAASQPQQSRRSAKG